jgi:hypothetical protein
MDVKVYSGVLGLCLGDRAPFGLIDFFTGVRERGHQ